MEQLKVSPSNSALMSTAALLRKLRSYVQPTTSESFLAAPREFLADALLSEGGISEVENWAHGNYPMEMQPGTSIPRFKSDREGSRGTRVLDAVGMLPVGTAASNAGSAAAGITIPIVKGANQSKGMASDLAKAVKLAEQLRAKGASETDIWQAAKVSQTPGMRIVEDPLKGKWSHELSLPDNLFEKFQMSLQDKIGLMERHSWEDDVPLDTKGFDSFVKMQAPKEGTYGLDALNFGDLGEQYPQMFRGGTLQAFQAKKPGRGELGVYNPDIETIGIHPATLLQSPGSGNSPRETFAHELQHKVQEFTGGSGGTQADLMRLTESKKSELLNLAAELRASGDPKLELFSDQLLTKLKQTPHQRYTHTTGEREADSAGLRDTWTQMFRDEVPPMQTHIAEPKDILDVEAFMAAKRATSEYTAKDPAMSNLLDLLRQEGRWK